MTGPAAVGVVTAAFAYRCRCGAVVESFAAAAAAAAAAVEAVTTGDAAGTTGAGPMTILSTWASARTVAGDAVVELLRTPAA